MRSPGRPRVAGRAEPQRFWKAIARGLSSEEAAVSCGVSPPVGGRWFREGGGMPPISLAPPSARSLSCAEREEIAILRAQGAGVRDMARRVRRAPSTVSRARCRNAATRRGGLAYRASTAPWCSAPGFLDSGLKVITSTLPRPVRRNRVALGLDSDSRTSPASTARCTSVETRARRGGVPRSFRSSAPTRDSPLTCG